VLLSGKYRGIEETKESGRHDAGRPHINIVGSLLWSRPIAWPNSWAMTSRATFGSERDANHELRLRVGRGENAKRCHQQGKHRVHH